MKAKPFAYIIILTFKQRDTRLAYYKNNYMLKKVLVTAYINMHHPLQFHNT